MMWFGYLKVGETDLAFDISPRIIKCFILYWWFGSSYWGVKERRGNIGARGNCFLLLYIFSHSSDSDFTSLAYLPIRIPVSEGLPSYYAIAFLQSP